MAHRRELIEETFVSPSGGGFHVRVEVVYEQLPAAAEPDAVSCYRVLVDGAPVGEVWRVEFARRNRAARFVVRSFWRSRRANAAKPSFVPRRSRREATLMMLVESGEATIRRPFQPHFLVL